MCCLIISFCIALSILSALTFCFAFLSSFLLIFSIFFFFFFFFFFFNQKTAYEMLISDWSSDVCSSDLTNFRKFFKDFSVNYYIFNKYSFFNIFEHKLGYFLFDRFLFNIFLKDFSVLSEEYSKLTNGITLEKQDRKSVV